MRFHGALGFFDFLSVLSFIFIGIYYFYEIESAADYVFVGVVTHGSSWF